MTFSPEKILIIKPSALGDVVQALPVASGLRKKWPKARIDWIISEAYQDLLQDHPAIDRLVIYPRNQWKKWRNWPQVPSWFSALRKEKYDLVLDLQGLFRSGLMTLATKSKRRLGMRSAREGARYCYTEIVEDNAVLAAERYLEFLRYLEIAPQPFDFQLAAKEKLPEELAPKKYLVFHPYSRWRTKLWPWRYYEELKKLMPQESIVLVGNGPWFPFEGKKTADLRGKLSLPQLLAVLEGAKMVLSTDSGPAHLAAALETPTLVLFGATDWRKTKPMGKKVSVATFPVFCSPCLRRKCYRTEKMECLVNISPQVIYKKIQSMIDQPLELWN